MTRKGDSATHPVTAQARSRATLLAMLAAFALVFCAMPASASASDINFAGSVLSSNGSPASGIKVSIIAQGSSDTQVTGSDGQFQLHAPPGDVSINLQRELDGSTWNYAAHTELTADLTNKVFRLPVLQTVHTRYRSVVGDSLPSGSAHISGVSCAADPSMNTGFPLKSSPGPHPFPYFPQMNVSIPDAEITDGHSPKWQMFACNYEPWLVTDVETTSQGFYPGMDWSTVRPGLTPSSARADVLVRSFSARFTMNTRNPFTGQTVALTGSDGATESTVTDLDGKVQMSDRPGTYDVSVSGVLNPSVQYSFTAPDVDMTYGFGPYWSYVGRINLDSDWTGIAVKDEDRNPVDGAFISGCTPITKSILNVAAPGSQCLKMTAWGGAAGTQSLWGGMADVTVRPPAGAMLKPKTTTISLDNDGPEYVAVTLEKSEVPYVPDVPYDHYVSNAPSELLPEPPFDYGDAAPMEPTAPPAGEAKTGDLVKSNSASCDGEAPKITSAPKRARSTSLIDLKLNCLEGGAIRLELIVGNRRIGGLNPPRMSLNRSSATIRIPYTPRLRLTRHLRSHPTHRARLRLTPMRAGIAGAPKTILISR